MPNPANSPSHSSACSIGWGCLSFLFFAFSFSAFAEHPFLIVRKGQYTELAARANQNPWKTMKASAISDAKRYHVPSSMTSYASFQVRDAISACALAYILDPGGRSTYVGKLRNLKRIWESQYNYLRKIPNFGGEWVHLSPVGAAYFNSILALDIIHDALSPSERSGIETALQRISDLYVKELRGRPVETAGVLGMNIPGMVGTWALYKGNTAEVNRQVKNYEKAFLRLFSDEGYFPGGPRYAIHRYGGGLDAKIHFMDVLEFTGTDNTYYSNPKMKGFYEWLYGYATSPFNRCLTFGDSDPISTLSPVGSAMCRAERISAHAARLAAWRNGGKTFPGRLLHYVLLRKRLPSSRKPASRIFTKDFAGFWQTNPTHYSLMGALSNTTTECGHAHKDMNAIYAAAYGEHVLLNSGYAGFGEKILGYTYNYVANAAYSSNTLTIEYWDHLTKTGGGISEGFISGSLDYASGFSGHALRFGTHYRNFCMIHPKDGANGYFLLFDEVEVDSAGRKIWTALHPNANNMMVVSKRKEYKSRISPLRYAGKDVHLSIFFGTEPAEVEIRKGLIASFSNKSFEGRYAWARYQPGSNRKRNIVTVLFPHDGSHKKASMDRLAGTGYTGARINLDNGVSDVAAEIAREDAVKLEGITLDAKATYFRKQNGQILAYFVRKGTQCDLGTLPKRGFQSDKPVTVYLRNGTGHILSPGASVSFYRPGIAGVFLGGKKLAAESQGEGWIKARIPAGTHLLSLVGSGINPAHAMGMGKPHLQIMPFGPSCVELISHLPKAGPFSVKVFDVQGRLVWQYAAENGKTGANRVIWRGSVPSPARAYIARLRAGSFRQARRFIVMP